MGPAAPLSSPDPQVSATATVADVATVATGSTCAVLTYSIPEDLAPTVQPGTGVVVTVRQRPVVGYVMRIREMPSSDPLYAKLVEITDAPPEMEPLTDDQRALAEWMAVRWHAPLAEAVRVIKGPYAHVRSDERIVLTDHAKAILAEGNVTGLSEREREILAHVSAAGGSAATDSICRGPNARLIRAAVLSLVRSGLLERTAGRVRRSGNPRLVDAVIGFQDSQSEDAVLSEPQSRVMDAVRYSKPTPTNPLPIADLMRAARCSQSPIRTLAASGILHVQRTRVLRLPITPHATTEAPDLTDHQKAALAASIEELRTPAHERRPILLHGITGSGKTEVYLALIEMLLRAGRGSIVLVPEIALTTQVVDVVSARFGADVAVLHSALGAGERYDEWDRVARGQASIAIGARSAVFAPVRNLGLIVIDEEHDDAYKQDNVPRYHARDAALKRAKVSDALVVMGSATPAMESYYMASQGVYRLLDLPTRVADRPLPNVHVVDMREEFRTAPAMFASAVREAIRARLVAREQTLLFLNRRGFSQFVLCRDCGYVIRCAHCSVSLTYHAARNVLVCHHCGESRQPPPLCPQCSGPRLRGFGLGTERVEQEIQRLFPSARIVRMDRDTTQRKGSHRAILERIRSGDADILIGTQMVAKGLDFPRLTLVGVVSADTGLNIPDFRASERTFQVLTQVAGRAGRSDTPGEVFIQAFTPEHYAVECASRQDYRGFYEKEIGQRRELRYPPFSCLANIVATSPDEHAAISAAQDASIALRGLQMNDLEVLGPSPAPLMRLRGRYRWHVVLRGASHEQVAEACRTALESLRSATRSLLTVDVDPITLS